MQTLKRLTTEYIDSEDRLRLSAETEDDAIAILWLTQRLLARLLVPVFAWLERQEGALPRVAVLQHFAQEAAAASLKPQLPVRGIEQTSNWLITSIDVSSDAEAVHLVFRGPAEQDAKLSLATHPLRQWLSILRKQCQKANWALDVWPSWLPEAETNTNTSRTRLH